MQLEPIESHNWLRQFLLKDAVLTRHWANRALHSPKYSSDGGLSMSNSIFLVRRSSSSSGWATGAAPWEPHQKREGAGLWIEQGQGRRWHNRCQQWRDYNANTALKPRGGRKVCLPLVAGGIVIIKCWHYWSARSVDAWWTCKEPWGKLSDAVAKYVEV